MKESGIGWTRNGVHPLLTTGTAGTGGNPAAVGVNVGYGSPLTWGAGIGGEGCFSSL